MTRTRKRLCVTAIMALLVAPSLSGCSEVGPPGAARAQAGVIGEFVEELKREDDEAEVRELRTLREVGREDHELENEEEREWQ
jgi:hypothetical protein